MSIPTRFRTIRERTSPPAVPGLAGLALVALSVVVLGACEAGPGGAPPGESLAPDGRPIVRDASELHILGTTDSIASVEDLAVLEDGTVWVLDSVEPLFVGFGPTGEVLAAHGRVGGGPEEFGAPTAFVTGGPDGEAWVFDSRRHALIRISSPAEARAEIPIPRDAIPPGTVLTGLSLLGGEVRTAWLGDEVVLPRRIGRGELEATSYWTTIFEADLVALNPETGSVRTVVSLPAALGDLTEHFEEVSSGFPPFPLWYRLWAVCAGDVVRLYDFMRDELRGFAADGVELEPVPVPVPFSEVAPREFARAAFDLAAAEAAGAVTPGMADMSAADSARILDAVVSRLDGSPPPQLAAVLPKYVDFRCAEDGTMWLQPLDLAQGGMEGGPSWVRITPDGASREVRFPERFDPYRFSSGRVWGVLRDELDVASVAWMDMPPGN